MSHINQSGSKWTVNELAAFNIDVVAQDVPTFFGDPALPESTVDPLILNHIDMPPGLASKSTRLFFRYLRDSTRSPYGAAGEDFTSNILSLLDFDEPNRVIHRRMELSFLMCGERVDAKPDICVLDDDSHVLLVQEYKCDLLVDDPECMLIAGAIAALSELNVCRRFVGLPTIAAKTFAGITMIGSAHIFYKIPITSQLVASVMTAQFPEQTTVVQKLVPPVPNIDEYLADGMQPLENRRIVLQCFEAFKKFV